MSDVSNSQIMDVLLGLKQDVGGIKADLVSHAAVFNKHVEDDKEIADTVKKLELSAAKASGKRIAYTTMGTFVGSLITLGIEYLKK